jgi:hypothetical protein
MSDLNTGSSHDISCDYAEGERTEMERSWNVV